MDGKKVLVIAGAGALSSRLIDALDKEAELIDGIPQAMEIKAGPTMADVKWIEEEKHKPHGPIRKRGKGKYKKYP